MTAFAVLRHGPTEWTAAGLIQGRTDIPLSAAGRVLVAGWRVPLARLGLEPGGFDWLTSPLARARETAQLLGAAEPAIEPRLIEMAFGEWEGRRLIEATATAQARDPAFPVTGLDFRPPCGESPREVQVRLWSLLAGRAACGRPAVAICHKGVIRALYALAVGWDMAGKPPEKPRDDGCHLFRLAADGTPTLVALNLPLAGGPP